MEKNFHNALTFLYYSWMKRILFLEHDVFVKKTNYGWKIIFRDGEASYLDAGE